MYTVRLNRLKTSNNVNAYDQWYDKYGFEQFRICPDTNDDTVVEITFEEYKEWVINYFPKTV